jgi:arsenite-transporting ATPase
MRLESLLPTKGTKFLFFSGKGGVGKTSLSCATAIWLAERGYKTLIVTTDPAPNLSDTFEQEIGHRIIQVNGTDNLWAMEINPDKATEDYRNRILDPARKLLPTDVLKVMEEQLSSPCATEVAAFDKFVDYILGSEYEVVVFDTAPTGHTMRLLRLPAAWSEQIELSGLVSSKTESIENVKEKFGKVMETMSDPLKTTIAFVVYPEATPIIEAWRASQELKTVGITTALVFANQVLPSEHCKNDFFKKRSQMQAQYLEETKRRFNVPILRMPLLDSEILGVETLIEASEILYGGGLNA